MLTEFNNHFILISGESGAGKTEASKKILQYYAVSCPSTTLLNTVRDKMLMSNPVLEVWWLLHAVEVHWHIVKRDRSSITVNELTFFPPTGFWKCQNTKKWQLKPIWEIYGHPVWQPGKDQMLDSQKRKKKLSLLLFGALSIVGCGVIIFAIQDKKSCSMSTNNITWSLKNIKLVPDLFNLCKKKWRLLNKSQLYWNRRRFFILTSFQSGHWTIGCVFSASCRAAVFRIMMPIGGCCWRPYPELPAGEIKGCASESRGEKLSHLLSAGRGRIRRLAASAGLGERLPAL